DLTDYGNDIPRVGLVGGSFYIYFPTFERIDLLDARTGKLLWRREGLTVDGMDLPELRHTKAFGDILILKSRNTYRAIRKSNGMDAWIVPVHSEKASDISTDRIVVIFEPEHGIFTVDLETGKTLAEVTLEQYVDALRTPFGPTWLVFTILDGNMLYV